MVNVQMSNGNQQVDKIDICLGFGHKYGLTSGAEYRAKDGTLLFTVDPSFDGNNKLAKKHVIGSAFGRGPFACEKFTQNQTGICNRCQCAAMDPRVKKIINQRRYQVFHEYKIAQRKKAGRDCKMEKLGLKRRAVQPELLKQNVSLLLRISILLRRIWCDNIINDCPSYRQSGMDWKSYIG